MGWTWDQKSTNISTDRLFTCVCNFFLLYISVVCIFVLPASISPVLVLNARVCVSFLYQVRQHYLCLLVLDLRFSMLCWKPVTVLPILPVSLLLETELPVLKIASVFVRAWVKCTSLSCTCVFLLSLLSVPVLHLSVLPECYLWRVDG